jgi:hypothetical protein
MGTADPFRYEHTQAYSQLSALSLFGLWPYAPSLDLFTISYEPIQPSASSETLLALCPLLYALCLLRLCLQRSAPQVPPCGTLLKRSAPYALCRMKLVLRLDVGRWSRILRVWEIVKN